VVWKRFAAALASALATLVVTVPAAFASGNPDRQLLPAPPDITAPFCGPTVGDILGHVAVDREYIKTYVEADGVIRQMVEGYQQDVFTVLATGRSVSFNASGPGILTFYPNGDAVFVFEGHTLFGDPVHGGLVVYTGLVDIDTTTGTVASNKGGATDLCAELT